MPRKSAKRISSEGKEILNQILKQAKLDFDEVFYDKISSYVEKAENRQQRKLAESDIKNNIQSELQRSCFRSIRYIIQYYLR